MSPTQLVFIGVVLTLLGRLRGFAARSLCRRLRSGSERSTRRRFLAKVIERLEALGYRPQIISLMGELRMGYGAAVKIENGHVLAGADPRRNGAAAALP